jgi:hypothetical protein
LAEALGKSTGELALELGRGLDVQPITIRRWISGEYAPRLLHLTQLRTHWGLVPTIDARGGGIGAVAEAPASFDGGYAALRTINHVFYCLERALGLFIFKGMQAFRIGRSQQVREQVVKILQEHDDLHLYYLFRDESEAARSLQGFRDRHFVKESGVLAQIHGVALSAAEDPLGLSISPASPFILRYGPAGIAEFKREIDIWYEIPVEELDSQGHVIDYGSAKSVFVQLPEEEAMRTWHAWQPFIRRILEEKSVEFDTTIFS